MKSKNCSRLLNDVQPNLRAVFHPSHLPIFPFLRVPRKLVEFPQLLVICDDDERIALFQLQIGSRVIDKSAPPASDRDSDQSRLIRNLCFAES